MSATEEPKFPMTVDGLVLPTRMPLIKPCSWFHGALRELAPHLSSLVRGIELGWPIWDVDSWSVVITDEGAPGEESKFAYVRIRIWPVGRMRVTSAARQGDGETTSVVEDLVGGDSVADAVDRCFRLLASRAQSIIDHLTEQHVTRGGHR